LQSCLHELIRYSLRMKILLLLILHFCKTVATLLGHGGVKAVMAESLLVKHQQLVTNRRRKRAPNFGTLDRILFGIYTLFMTPSRIAKSAVVIKPSTLMKFHRALVSKKYHLLFSSKKRSTPGPKGPSRELINAIIAIKRNNPRYGCPRIADMITNIFDIPIDKDVVRRVLERYYHPDPTSDGPSWLTFLGHTKDSLWSLDLFRCESVLPNSYWIVVVMDQFSRRIIGFAVHKGNPDGPATCRMFNSIISKLEDYPKHLSTDHDPLFEYFQWKANLRIIDIEETKTIPYVPVSHPFIERLIGTIRREYLDHVFFWSANDLENKLSEFQEYYNSGRVHASLGSKFPLQMANEVRVPRANLVKFGWQAFCRGLFLTPIAA